MLLLLDTSYSYFLVPPVYVSSGVWKETNTIQMKSYKNRSMIGDMRIEVDDDEVALLAILTKGIQK